MDQDSPRHYLPARDIDWTGGAGQPAGIYWLDGRCRMAAHGTPAEANLLAAGAIHIATLRFEPDFLEGRRPGYAAGLVAFRRSIGRHVGQ